MQQGLREPTSGLREPQGPTVRASWMAVANRLGLAIVFGLFLAATGLHTEFNGGFWARAAYLDAVSVAALFILSAVMHLVTVRTLWLRTIIIIGVMIPLMGTVVFGLDAVFARPAPGLDQIPSYLATSVVISTMIGLLMAFSASKVKPQVIVTSSAPAADAPAPPRLLERLSPRLRGADIWAVSAEDHYLRVHTSRGQELILLRLSDAMAELEGIEGAQTHRSWWVARAAIADAKRGDGTADIHLPDGTAAPVSRTRIKTLRELGWI